MSIDAGGARHGAGPCLDAYRFGWFSVTLPLGVIGFGAALVLLPARLVILVPLFGAVGVLVSRGFSVDPAPAEPRDLDRMVRSALLWGAAGAAFAGFSTLLGSITLLLALMLAATSPYAIRAARRRWDTFPLPTGAQLEMLARSLAYANPTWVPFVPPPDPRLLSDAELHEIWQDGQSALRPRAGRRDARCALDERGRLLAELERRQPSLLKAWLDSGPGDPDPPSHRASRRCAAPSTIDWDQLTRGQATDR